MWEGTYACEDLASCWGLPAGIDGNSVGLRVLRFRQHIVRGVVDPGRPGILNSVLNGGNCLQDCTFAFIL